MSDRAAANELGLNVEVGSVITADYYFPEHLARRIRAEIDPNFRPLWVRYLWRTPNDGFVWTGHHILARHVPFPRSEQPPIPNLILPAPHEKVHGVTYQAPIVMGRTLDGLTDEELQAGVLPRYEPFTENDLRDMRWAMWRRNNVRSADRIREGKEARRDGAAYNRRQSAARARYRVWNDRLRFKKHLGVADSVFVSHTLRKEVA